jgi:hypothetical protein
LEPIRDALAMNTPAPTTRQISAASDKRTDGRTTASAASVANVGACEQPAMDKQSIWHLSFKPEGDGPPAELRIRALLKRAKRSHGLRCVDFSTSPGLAMDGRALPRRLRGVAAGGLGGQAVAGDKQTGETAL